MREPDGIASLALSLIMYLRKGRYLLYEKRLYSKTPASVADFYYAHHAYCVYHGIHTGAA